MYDNDSYCDWHHSLQFLESAAAAANLAIGPAVGEVWRVIACSGYHNDPAAHTLYWSIRQGASTLAFENGTNRAADARHQLYDVIKVSAPILLRYGDYIVIESTAPMAAGKVLRAVLYAEVLVGVTQ